MPVSQSPPLLKIDGLWKSYGRVQAVRGLDLEVVRGQILGLLGPNGSGKTTTMKAVLRLTKKDSGKICVLGRDIDQASYEYKRWIGYVPEAMVLPEYLTVWEFLAFSAKIHGVEQSSFIEVVEKHLDAFRLADRKGEYIGTLSRGMKQKVAIVSALIHEPDLLLLDEPLLFLDPEAQHVFKQVVKEKVGSGAGALLSTHLLDTVERFCDKVTVILEGRKIAEDSLHDLRSVVGRGTDATLEEVFLSLTSDRSIVMSAGRESVRE